MINLVQADAIRLPFQDRTFSACIGSPPYSDARTYGIGAQRNAREWVDWMLAVTAECLRVTDGPVIWVAAGVTRDWTYWPACEGLAWRWFDEGWSEYGPGTVKDGSSFRPCYWHRVGIPGSGGDQWYRADVEYALCFKRPGPLTYGEPLANGKPPKFRPGGPLSYRGQNGSRLNGWTRNADGTKSIIRYTPPEIANPGNLLHVEVGGGHMSHPLAHENEAPFPEAVPQFFIRSHVPPDGIVLDPFGGSGTTGAAAILEGRRFVLSDIRPGVGALDTARRRLADPDRYGIKDNPSLAASASRMAPMPGQLDLFTGDETHQGV